jgi:hypothetical protein
MVKNRWSVLLENSLPVVKICRVRERRCRHSLPSEPDVKVSLHPAQAATKPCVNRAGQRGNFPRDLDDMDLQPADRTHTLEPVELVRACCPAGGRTHGLRHVHLPFPPCTGSACFLVTNDPLEVCPFARRDNATVPIHSVTERPWLFPASSARYSHNAPCGTVCLDEAECRVCHVPLKQR